MRELATVVDHFTTRSHGGTSRPLRVKRLGASPLELSGFAASPVLPSLAATATAGCAVLSATGAVLSDGALSTSSGAVRGASSCWCSCPSACASGPPACPQRPSAPRSAA
ncbi:MAG: hypothetical protein U0269_09020 [Polyangiales bacterium]